MDSEQCKKKIKSKLITIRITEGEHQWIKDNDFSISKIFRQALEELGYKEVKR